MYSRNLKKFNQLDRFSDQNSMQHHHHNQSHRRPRVVRASEYRNLRHVVPSLRRQRDVGKVEVVTEAARYIDHLHKTLIERFVLCGIPDSLKDVLGTDDANELNSQHIMNLITQMATKQRQQQQQPTTTVHSQRPSVNTISEGNALRIYGNQRAQNRNCQRAVQSSLSPMQVAARLHRRGHQQRGIKTVHLAAAARSVAAQQRIRNNNRQLAITGNIKASLNGHVLASNGIDSGSHFSTTTTASLQPTATPVVRANKVTWCARRALPIARRRLNANNLPVSATDKEEEDKSNYDD